jgi:hypothetical protein
MKRGGDSDIIGRWRELARREPDRKRRAELVLARVFAELVGRQDVWIEALRGWEMKESKIIGTLVAEAKAEAKAEMLLQVLRKPFKTVPDDLRTTILAVQDAERLTAWVETAPAARTLRRFREQTGL